MGCGLLLAIENGTPIRCGDKMMGKERFCLSCKVVKEAEGGKDERK